MKKMTLILAMTTYCLSAIAQTTTVGKVFQDGKDKNKTFVLGDDKAMNVVLDGMKAYNSNDAKKDLSYYTKERVQKDGAFNIKWHKEMKSLNQVPYWSMPIKLKGAEDNLVLTLSEESRVWNNGSKEKVYLFEITTVNKDSKISDFAQFQYRPKSNEFGSDKGGKVYLKDSSTTVQFTNRGEIATIEKLQAALNKLDINAIAALCTDSITWNHSNGVTERALAKDFFAKAFSGVQSYNWKVNMIIPYKLTDTDPESGILVNATSKQVAKDGTVTSKRQMIGFTYNLDGKISAANNFTKDIVPVVTTKK
ncbi:MAG: nuclear transport factor 2 family protein [Chitinophagia bacterium]|jgi:hypothetical protein